MNLKENMAVKKLVEHPENKKLFKDIKDTNPTFWLEFIDSIKTFGVIEPLIVNRESMQVRSGNQRLKAAIEIGLETVPVLMVDKTDKDDEIARMIASNVFRRTIDPFSMFEYIGRLRKGTSVQTEPSKNKLSKDLHKSNRFISAADIFKDMPKEQKESLEEWFHEKAEGAKAKSEGELIAMIKNMQLNETTLKEEIESREGERVELELEKKESKLKVEELEEDITKKEKEISDLINTDYESELEGKEAEIDKKEFQIAKLSQEQRKLKEKIIELRESPDINIYLKDSYEKLLAINVTLRSIMQNRDALNPVIFKQFGDALKVTFDIIKEPNKKEQRSLS